MVKTFDSMGDKITSGENNLTSNFTFQTIGGNPNHHSKFPQNYNNQYKLYYSSLFFFLAIILVVDYIRCRFFSFDVYMVKKNKK
jgi:hypothetical protein